MFALEDLEKAVKIQKKAYQFLLYMKKGIDNNTYSTSKIHQDESPAEAVYNWIEVYYDYLPPNTLPPKEDLNGFCNYFASYLTTSFAFVDEPIAGDIGAGCYCDICRKFLKLTHLKSISPKNQDREMAQEKMIGAIDEVAIMHEVDLSEASLDIILSDHQSVQDAAIIAYTIALFERIQSAEGGLYILALWRIFAWDKNGSPLEDFEFTAKNILSASKSLKAKILSFSNA